MEALGVASSIAGLIGLAELVVFKGSKYAYGVKNARSDIKDLFLEVQSLYGVLNRLKLLDMCLEKEQSADSIRFQNLDHFQICRKNLDHLKKSLDKLDSDSVKTKLLWPFKVSETKELIEKIARNKRDLSDALTADGLTALVTSLSSQSTLVETVQDIEKEFQRITVEKAESEKDEQKKKVFDWCTKVTPYEKHRNAKTLKYPNTVLWFFDSYEYKTWVETPNSAIWLFGIPGAGKTILTSAVIEEVKFLAFQTPGYVVAYYYCEYKRNGTQILYNILGSLINQICACSEEAFEELRQLHEKCNNPTHPILPTNENLEKLFKHISRKFETIVVIIDGLDECSFPEERKNLLNFLSTLNAPQYGNIKTICTSRDLIYIREQLARFDKISIAARSNDLELYVTAGIEQRIESKSLRLRDPSLKEIIINTIVSKANGMFQWAKCQLDHLCHLSTDKERRKALDTLPEDLFETYKSILTRVNEGPKLNQSMVKKILSWLAFAKEPLTVNIVAIAITVEINSKSVDLDDLPDEDSLLWWCSSLVTKDENTGVLALSHFTVKEFLMDEKLLGIECLRPYHLSDEDSHRLLAKVCLTYLSFDSFSNWQFRKLQDYEEQWEEIYYDSSFPLVRYAVQYWPHHAKNSVEDEILLDLMCRLFHPDKTPNFLLWLEGYFSWLEWPTPKSCSTLHCAATLGLTAVCAWLIKEGVDVNAHDKILGTPLICAVRGKFDWFGGRGRRAPVLSTVQTLLDAGAHEAAETIILGYDGEDTWVSSLSLALDALDINPEHGTNIFKELMNANCVSNFADAEFWHLHGFDYYDYDHTGSGGALSASATSLFKWTLNHKYASSLDVECREKMVLFITQSTNSCEEQIFSSGKANGELFQSTESITDLVISAAEYGQTRLAKSLISKNIDPIILSKGLPVAASSGSCEIVDVLLQYCPRSDQNVLHEIHMAWIAAARAGHIAIMKKFITYGIDVNLIVEEEEFEAALPAMMRQPGTSEKIIIQTTALATAIRECQYGVVEFLSEMAIVDFAKKDIKYSLVLLAVTAPLRDCNIVELLVKRGTDPMETTDDGRGALHHLLNRGHSQSLWEEIRLLRVLIDFGCKVNTVDNAGNTPLHIFCSMAHTTNDHCEVVQLLLGDGEVRSVQRKDGWLPLHLAVQRRLPSKTIKLLIPDDLSRWNKVGGWTPIHLAVSPQKYADDENHMVRILKILTSIEGVDVNVLNHSADKPLTIVACHATRTSALSWARMLSMLLSKGADVNSLIPGNKTVLHLLAKSGFQQGLVEIIRHNPKMDHMDDQGLTAIHWAIQEGHVDIVYILLKHIQNIQREANTSNCMTVEQWTGNGYLPLHLAAIHGRSDIISLLRNSEQISDINVRSRDSNKATALHFATAYRWLSTVKILLELGAEIDCFNAWKSTPLHLAAQCGFENIAQLLIQKGARSDIGDKDGLKPWVRAALGGHKGLKEALEKCSSIVQLQGDDRREIDVNETDSYHQASAMEDKVANTKEIIGVRKSKPKIEVQRISAAIIKAAETNDANVCRALLETGVDPNEPLDEMDSTALHIACGYRSWDVVKLLLDLGAQVNIKDKSGYCPIHTAAMNYSTDIIKMLVEAGANLSARNKWMQTPLHLAALKGPLEAVQTILELAVSNKNWESPPLTQQLNRLSTCSSGIRIKTTKMIENDPSARLEELLEARDFERETPLNCAINEHELNIAKYLVKRGANIFSRGIWNISNDDILLLSGKFADKDLIETLLSRNLNVNASNISGFTCLHKIAGRDDKKEGEVIDIAKSLIEAGADLSSNNISSSSPLHCASHVGSSGLVKLLIEKSSKDELNVKSVYYGTPLYAAAFRGHLEVVRILLEAGADMAIDWLGQTTLEAAQEGEHEEVVKLLKEHQKLKGGNDWPTIFA